MSPPLSYMEETICPEWFLNLDGGILLWLQEAVRNAVLTPLFTLYTHLGDSGLMWIALSVLLLCFKKTRKAGAAGLMALLLSLMFTNGILKHLVERPRPWLTVEGLTPLIAEHDPTPLQDTPAPPLPQRRLVPHSAPPVGGGDGGGAGRPDGLLTAVCRGPLPQ
ncbi:MAG: hypothetical protein ACLUES_16625 [Flavonifractor plautii]